MGSSSTTKVAGKGTVELTLQEKVVFVAKKLSDDAYLDAKIEELL